MPEHSQLGKLGIERPSTHQHGHPVHRCCSLEGKLDSGTVRAICGRSFRGRIEPVVDVIHRLAIGQRADLVESDPPPNQAVHK